MAKSVKFKAAIKDYLKRYWHFSGRTTRSGFWWVFLLLGIIWLLPVAWIGVAGLLRSQLGMISGRYLYLLVVIIMLGLFIPTIAMSIRRYRDAGLTGRGAGTLWLFNILLSSLDRQGQNRAITIISILIGLLFFIATFLKRDRLMTNSDNPLVTFFLRKK